MRWGRPAGAVSLSPARPALSQDVCRGKKSTLDICTVWSRFSVVKKTMQFNRDFSPPEHLRKLADTSLKSCVTALQDGIIGWSLNFFGLSSDFYGPGSGTVLRICSSVSFAKKITVQRTQIFHPNTPSVTAQIRNKRYVTIRSDITFDICEEPFSKFRIPIGLLR